MYWGPFTDAMCLPVLILALLQVLAGEDISVVAQTSDVDQNIRNQVAQYVRTKDWAALRRGLEAALDRNSAAYAQLQAVGQRTRYPLFDLCGAGHVDLATALLSAGLPVDTRDSGGDTMLHGAAQGGQLATAEALLARGADVNSKNNDGLTPLMWAVQSGSLEVVQRLVRAGADTAAKDDEGYSALDLSRGSRVPAISTFLSQYPH